MSTSRADHPLLFDIHPLGTEPPIAQRVITPGCLLPLPENKVVDLNRVCAILGGDKRIVRRLIAENHLRRYRLHGQSPWQIEYDSVVEFCDQLRIDYHIADRRLAAPRQGRWRDDQLLPFPLADTVYTQDAMTGLSLPRMSVIRLCEEGAFECYRLLPYPGIEWRLSKTSLFRYADRLRADLNQRSVRRVRP